MNKLFALVAVAALAGTAACEKEAQVAPEATETVVPAAEPAVPVVADPAAPVVVDPNAPAVVPATNDSMAATTPIPAESGAAKP